MESCEFLSYPLKDSHVGMGSSSSFRWLGYTIVGGHCYLVSGTGFWRFLIFNGPSISAAPESGSGCGLPPRLLFLVWDWWLFICLAGSGAVSSLFLRYGLFIPFKGVLLGWRGGLAMTLAEPALRSAGGGCVRDCGYRRESIHHHHHLQNGKCESIDLISGGTNVTRVWHVWRSDQDKP